MTSATLSQRQRERCIEFIELAFVHRAPEAAAARYLRPDYIQHEPGLADGHAGFVAGVHAVFEKYPEISMRVHRAAAEDDLVFLHMLFKRTPEDLGTAVVDVYKMDGEQIAEHWEVATRVPEQPPGEHAMV